MNIDAKHIENQLNQLEEQITTKENLNANIIKDWAAECIAIFSYLQVPHEIIRGFMLMFEYAEGIHKFPGNGGGGTTYDYWIAPARTKDRIKGFYYTNIAFKTARNLLQKVADLERLIPQNLIKLFKNSDYHDISTILESIESSYQANDTDNLIASAQSLLQTIVNLDPTMRACHKDGLKKQLNKLQDRRNQAILDNFGCDAEIICIFYSFRYLRNTTSQHKTGINFCKLPISIGYGFASLVLYFLYCTMSVGELIKIEQSA